MFCRLYLPEKEALSRSYCGSHLDRVRLLSHLLSEGFNSSLSLVIDITEELGAHAIEREAFQLSMLSVIIGTGRLA